MAEIFRIELKSIDSKSIVLTIKLYPYNIHIFNT